jgi:hypothetical protein
MSVPRAHTDARTARIDAQLVVISGYKQELLCVCSRSHTIDPPTHTDTQRTTFTRHTHCVRVCFTRLNVRAFGRDEECDVNMVFRQ